MNGVLWYLPLVSDNKVLDLWNVIKELQGMFELFFFPGSVWKAIQGKSI